jgi:hypothetical protein
MTDPIRTLGSDLRDVARYAALRQELVALAIAMHDEVAENRTAMNTTADWYARVTRLLATFPKEPPDA